MTQNNQTKYDEFAAYSDAHKAAYGYRPTAEVRQDFLESPAEERRFMVETLTDLVARYAEDGLLLSTDSGDEAEARWARFTSFEGTEDDDVATWAGAHRYGIDTAAGMELATCREEREHVRVRSLRSQKRQAHKAERTASRRMLDRI